MRINFKGTTKEGRNGVPYWQESQILEVLASSPMMGHHHLCWLWKRSLVEDEELWEQYEEVSYPKIPEGCCQWFHSNPLQAFCSPLFIFVLWYIIRMIGSMGNWNQYWWFSSCKAVSNKASSKYLIADSVQTEYCPTFLLSVCSCVRPSQAWHLTFLTYIKA